MSTSTSTLLIIEDFPADRELYRRALLADPNITYQLLEAESVAEGLELCQSQKIDAVLLDYMLPDGDGLEFLGELADRHDLDPPAVVMLTGQGSESIAVRAIKLGAQDYLVKRDLTPELLQLTVRKAILERGSANKNHRLRLQLQEVEDRFRISILQGRGSANENMSDCVGLYSVMRDRAGQIIDFRCEYLNPAALERNRIGRDDLGKSLWDLFPSLVGTDVEHEFRRALIDRVAVQMEMWFEPTASWFESHLDPATEGVGIYFRDISAAKRLEAERLEAEQERDRFFNLSIDLLGIANFDGYFTRLNPAFERVLGFTNAELTAQPFVDFVHPDDRADTVAAAQQLMTGETVVSFENRYRCRNGSYRWLLWSAIPDLEQNVMYVSGHNITERKRAEGDLLESQARLRTGIEVAGVGLARFDYQTNLVALSPEAAVLYGFAPDITFVTREQIHATFHPDERAALEQAIAQVVDPTGTGWFAHDHRVVWPCGRVRCLSVRKQVFFDRSGAVARPIYAVLAAIDITERKQIQSDLEARNQELDSFVHIVSHDLKAPLRAVSNLSEWIEEDLAESLTPANQQQMNLLRDRLERMSATIDGLLEYARIGRTTESSLQGTGSANEPVAVAELVAQTIETLAPPPTFQIAIAKNLPTLYTQRLLLTQVFANLIGNSIKHHDRLDGAIHIGIAERSDVYEFAIADDGPGIETEQHERVFEIFQAVNPQKRSDSTGIGLAIVKKIIEAEGGKIWLESQPGKGTTFHFTWPKRSDRG
jgi:PAS domain S-box-containing protein